MPLKNWRQPYVTGGLGLLGTGPSEELVEDIDALDVAVDPNEPPLPGKVSYDQAKKFATAWLRGQPHKAAIATTLFKDKIQQFKS